MMEWAKHVLGRSKKRFLTLKLDISKVCDCIEWGACETSWRKWDLSNNGLSFLRSHTLSLSMVIPALSLPIPLIGKRRASSRGVSICQEAPSVTHLLFADDCILFSRAKTTDCNTIKEILKYYEHASRQQVNLSKSAVCLSYNINSNLRNSLAGLLVVERVDRHENYLIVGRKAVSATSILFARPNSVASWHMPAFTST
ncbi:hypothetical protein DVH24_011239 [Malus domestica]|uniref:Reverse transcriptase domain-containing protein n=1 Tax=Malus domestica TaxID=3750 RepID=A0A498JYP2_MALDO|nr:hypothetical protein DVH24_011239 [Malus domestica]